MYYFYNYNVFIITSINFIENSYDPYLIAKSTFSLIGIFNLLNIHSIASCMEGKVMYMPLSIFS